MTKNRRVVVTGIGVVSPIGNNKKEVKDSLYFNNSGINFSKDYSDLGFRSHVHGDININFEDFLDKKDLRFMDVSCCSWLGFIFYLFILLEIKIKNFR